ncbi:hypothetical protein ACFW0H_18375 [Pseudomonas sp. CR3202]|uniref:hypothetical protein n=1 Tax=Pseudomonas sp. CR3202 TaxID=3351532 RepID=UPI003BF21E7D
MSNILRFIPKTALSAKENLKDFIEHTKTNQIPLLKSNKFENNQWCVSGLLGRNKGSKYIYFAKVDFKVSKRRPKDGTPGSIPVRKVLQEPFLSFSKSLIIYMHGTKKSVAIKRRLLALRYLERALLETNASACPTSVSPEILSKACNFVLKDSSQQSAYDISKQLSLVYQHMLDLGLVTAPSEWHPPISTSESSYTRLGKEFDEARAKKLPSPHALLGLAKIFNSDSNNPTDIMVSSITAIMLCAPDRSTEALYAPMNLITDDWVDPDTGEIGIGMRWFPAKGGKPMVKTVIPSMRDIAKRAVSRLLHLSGPARQLANWYENNPNKIYLPPNLEHLRKQELINYQEAHSILFSHIEKPLTRIQLNRVGNWMRVNKISRSRINPKQKAVVKFADLESAVLKKLPVGFPIMDPTTGMKYSEALCIVREQEFLENTEPSACSFTEIKYSSLQKGLKSTDTNKSIFERHNLTDDDGKFSFLSTHQLRHYLNTIARQSGLLSEDEIAAWSGRKRIQQNATYNHQSDRDVISIVRAAVGDPTKGVGPISNIDNRVFIRREDFAELKIITAHTTENGYCIHDFAQSPCPAVTDCMNCSDQVCIKGDLRAEKNLRQYKTELDRLSGDARKAFEEEVLGAAEWFQHHQKTLDRVNQLIAILDDPNTPEGAVIQLNGVTSPCRIRMAEQERKLSAKRVGSTITSLADVSSHLNSTSRGMVNRDDR